MIDNFVDKYRLAIDNLTKEALEHLLVNKTLNCSLNWRLPYGVVEALIQDYDLIIRTHPNCPIRMYEILDKSDRVGDKITFTPEKPKPTFQLESGAMTKGV